MKILVGGQKGGVGKTTLTTNLTAYHAQTFDLMLVDTDKRQNSAAKWAARRKAQKDVKKVHCSVAYGDLRETIEDFGSRYEQVILDAGGRDSIEFRTGLLAADICLVPFSPSQHDIDTLPYVNSLIEESRVYNPNLKAFLIFVNCPQNMKAREKRIKEIIANELDSLDQLKILETRIVNRISYLDTAGNGLGVTEMSDLKAKEEIINLSKEVLNYGQ